MKVAALISAPAGNTDFSGKLLLEVNGKSVIANTVDSVKQSGLFADVIVVTNDAAVETNLSDVGVQVVKVNKAFDNYIERLAEASLVADADMFVCIPGDHLLLNKLAVERLLQLFEGVTGKDVQVASIVQKIQNDTLKEDRNTVKVVLGLRMHALYMSRYPIPYMQHDEAGFACYEHINIVACRKDAMLRFLQWPPSPLERAEQIHALRFVENGVQIKMHIAQYPYFKIRSEADVAGATAFINNAG